LIDLFTLQMERTGRTRDQLHKKQKEAKSRQDKAYQRAFSLLSLS